MVFYSLTMVARMNKIRIVIFAALLTVTAGLSAATFNLFQPAAGILKGNPSTYVTTAAIATDVISLWTGTCNASTFLRADGSCQAAAGSASGANPTATIGLTAVNGAAATFLRSDGAPALSQAIAPTWTAPHIFSSTGAGASRAATITAANPFFGWVATGSPADEKIWEISASGAGAFIFRTRTDAEGAGANWLVIDRTGTTVDSIALAATAVTVNGQDVRNTALFTAGTLGVDRGGTGAVTLSGVLKGNGTSAIGSAASSDVISLWTGTCNSTTFLRADGSCQAAGGGGGGSVTSVALTMPSGLSVTGSPVTTSGTLAVTTALSGIINGTGTGFANAVASDVVAEFSGTCNSTTFLRGDGSCNTPVTPAGANPTGTIGLTAVNGAAATFLRSDGAPALSQAIVPTWTAQHTFGLSASITNPNILLSSARTVFELNETDAAADNRLWTIQANAETFDIFASNDAGSVNTSWLKTDRTGTTIDTIALAGTTVTVNGQDVRNTALFTAGTLGVTRGGTGTTTSTGSGSVVLSASPTISGTLTSTGVVSVADGAVGVPAVSFSSDPDTGMYRVSTNNLGISAGGLPNARFVYDGVKHLLQFFGVMHAVDDGTAALPAYSWDSDQNTGIYRVGPDNLAISVGGSARLQITSSLIGVGAGLQFQVPDGSVGTPSYSFGTDTDTGFFRSGANEFRAVAGGAANMIWGPSLNYSRFPFLNADGAVGTPSYTFESDSDTGIYHIGVNSFGISAGGVNVATVSVGSFGINGIGTAGAFQTSDGSAAAPGFSFLADSDTGVYRIGANSIGIATAGVNAFAADASFVYGRLPFVGVNGSASSPTYSFESDPDTGIFRVTTNTLGLSTAGTERLSIDGTGAWSIAGGPGTGGTYLRSNGAGTSPTWGALDASNITSGVLAVANGGTGASTSTGTGSTVRSASPTLTGTLTAATIAATALTVGGTNVCRSDGTNCSSNFGRAGANLTSGGGSCTVNTGSFNISGCTFNSTGNYTVTLIGGGASQPICNASTVASANTVANIASYTLTTAVVTVRNFSGTATDANVSVNCTFSP